MIKRILLPKQEFIDQLDSVLDRTRKLYRSVQDQEHEEHPDYDNTEFDSDVWLNSLKYITNETAAPFIWYLSGEDQGMNPINLYLHSGSAHEDGKISFNLYEPHMEEGLDFDIFKMVLMRFIEHEAVHMHQRDKMGHAIYANRFTGFQRGEKDMHSTSIAQKKKGMRTYLSDPQEMMAHARDLYNEINSMSVPNEVIRNLNKYIEYLPTWKKFLKSGFTKQNKVVKRFLKYTIAYMEQDNEIKRTI